MVIPEKKKKMYLQHTGTYMSYEVDLPFLEDCKRFLKVQQCGSVETEKWYLARNSLK